ncbi:hypothetical protein F5I97DRAFT_1946834 [Phlebopus sp. FC_14]|nr:hypothetical protein F5I97DRAFT_1946834 [Phlebopus sp. FC_14]
MGLFKRFFSIGSKKSKKQFMANHDREPLPPVAENVRSSKEDDTEEAVNRLLRSSSARYTIESAMDFASLAPLPHPINSLIPPPTSSTTSIDSVSQRSTYSVTVHGRTVHSRTEFPNAYPPMDKIFTPKRSNTDSARRRSKSVPITPREQNRLLKLRQDPSVASLLNYYDDQGCLDSHIFSNTPPSASEGRVQRRRTGSTLRQLLGHPSSPELRNPSTEGDISWAERFLGESDGNSSASSSGLPTPADTPFIATHFAQADRSMALSTECDTSAANHRTFSSLEVELSISTDIAHQPTINSPYENPATPQRASQIFGFLTDKKKVSSGSPSRLPQLKAPPRFPSDSLQTDIPQSNIPRRTSIHVPQSVSPITQQCFSPPSDAIKAGPPSPTMTATCNNVHDDLRTPPLVVNLTGQSGRVPRGPRAPSKIPSRSSTGLLPAVLSLPAAENETHAADEQLTGFRSALGEKSNAGIDCRATARSNEARCSAPYSQIPKLRTASGSSVSSTGSRKESDGTPATRGTSPLYSADSAKPGPAKVPIETLSSTSALGEKENDVRSRLLQPSTPVRAFGHRLPHIQDPPSPASSSELSPVAKQLMANLRQQRMHARQRERQTGKLGSGRSRIHY